MKKREVSRPKTLSRRLYEISQVYNEVIADRFDYRGKAEVGLTNWQIRVQEIAFVSTRGVDYRYRVYFPLTRTRRIVVSLDKKAKREDLWALVSEIVESARLGDVKTFRDSLHGLINYCLAHKPMLYIEYSTKNSYMMQRLKTLKIKASGVKT